MSTYQVGHLAGLSLQQVIQLQKDGWRKRVRIVSVNGHPKVKRHIWMNDKIPGVYFLWSRNAYNFMVTGVPTGPKIEMDEVPEKPKKPRFI